MTKKSGKRLVIDASIARASGEGEHPTAKNCRDFLLTVRKQGHFAVMTPEIEDEWNTHQSKFTYRWRRSMYASRKCCKLPTCDDAILRDKIAKCEALEGAIEAMLKDAHLLEAALATDNIVFALDDVARGHFRKAAARVGQIRLIAWMNPDKDSDCQTWLTGELDSDEIYKLGYAALEE